MVFQQLWELPKLTNFFHRVIHFKILKGNKMKEKYIGN